MSEPLGCAPWGTPRWGKRRSRQCTPGPPAGGESRTARPLPWFPVPRDPREEPGVVPQGPGAETSPPRERRLRMGRGRLEDRLRPPPPLEGKGRRWPALSEPDGQRTQRGRPAGTGWHRASRSGLAANAVTCVPLLSSVLPRAQRSPFINSPPDPRPPGAGASRERRAAARPSLMGRAPRR